MSLDNKIALVTGGSRGIGETIARRLASKGAKVVINYVGSVGAAEALVKDLEEKHGAGVAIAVQADVSNLLDIERLIRTAVDKYGHIDFLINNAGIAKYISILDTTPDDFDRTFNINVKAPFFLTQQALKQNALRQGGRIINFSSSTTAGMLPDYSLYSGSKGAVEQFSRHWAKELSPRGINVNTISPGPVATSLFFEGKTEQQIAFFSNAAALGRLGQPDDIADVVAFLVSDEARWITGQNIKVNGGLNA